MVVIGADGAFRILTVCSHNRTRSVMMAALIDSMLMDRLGSAAATVTSAGFGPPRMPPIPDAVRAMRARGLDVSGHRSRRIEAADVESADLVLTAERDHVIKIAALVPSAFRHTLTLPEFIDLASGRDVADLSRDGGSSRSRGLADAAATFGVDRTALTYIHADIPEVDDPTGLPARAFDEAVVRIEAQCRQVAVIVQSWAR